MNNQLRWLTSNKNKIYKNSRLLYKLYKEDKLSDNIKKRCCNFPLLESICLNYKQ